MSNPRVQCLFCRGNGIHPMPLTDKRECPICRGHGFLASAVYDRAEMDRLTESVEREKHVRAMVLLLCAAASGAALWWWLLS